MTTTNKNPGCLTAIFSIFRQTGKTSDPIALPYQLRNNLLSPAEFSFYKVLANLVQKKLEIQCKVRLADIFYTPRGTNISHFNRIAGKHIDFLLCEPTTMKPVLGIELDDSSHNKPNRQQRDNFIDDVFKTTGLPLLHLPAKQAYNQQELSTQISQVLTKRPENQRR